CRPSAGEPPTPRRLRGPAARCRPSAGEPQRALDAKAAGSTSRRDLQVDVAVGALVFDGLQMRGDVHAGKAVAQVIFHRVENVVAMFDGPFSGDQEVELDELLAAGDAGAHLVHVDVAGGIAMGAEDA